jgi:hypothetical protein
MGGGHGGNVHQFTSWEDTVPHGKGEEPAVDGCNWLQARTQTRHRINGEPRRGTAPTKLWGQA